MNSFEVLPTEYNLISALKDDLLKRNKDLIYFYELLLAQESAGAIAIDGRWGSGKTFFVKQSMLIINAMNPASIMDEEVKANILKILPFKTNNSIEKGNFNLAVYYDAWENDNDTDPVFSIIYEIAKQLYMTYPFDKSTNICKTAGAIIEAISGRNINGIIDNLKADNLLSKFKEEKELYENLKDFFGDILVERGSRLIVFIDELDRCKPSFAVRLLEQIKHYLCDERVTFVFSVNLGELQHTIKHFYGNELNACRYLDRFFNLRISLPPADMKSFCEKMGLDANYAVETVCMHVIKNYNLQLREITRYYRQIKTAIYVLIYENHYYTLPYEKGRYFLLLYIVPLVIGLKIVNINLYDDFINGMTSKPLKDLFEAEILQDHILNSLLNRNESFESNPEKQLVTKEQIIEKLYSAIFVEKYIDKHYGTQIGEYLFESTSKDFVIAVSSMLSNYANFEI